MECVACGVSLTLCNKRRKLNSNSTVLNFFKYMCGGTGNEDYVCRDCFSKLAKADSCRQTFSRITNDFRAKMGLPVVEFGLSEG